MSQSKKTGVSKSLDDKLYSIIQYYIIYYIIQFNCYYVIFLLIDIALTVMLTISFQTIWEYSHLCQQ